MIAVDTNIVVRFITADDLHQWRRAHDLFEHDAIFIPKSVLLETEWVLRSGYGFAPRSILDALRGLLGLSNVAAEDSSAVGLALEWFGSGIDFADALHLASCGPATGLATFDRNFERRARAFENAPAVALLA